MIKYNFLNGFIERLNTYEIIRSLAFFSLYNEWFLEVSQALHDEILENLSLTTTDKKIYLKYVKKQASEKVVYQNDNKFLEKWIKIYQLEESKFPFIDNEEVQMLLDTDVKDPVLDNKKKKLCTNIQMDFYCHAAMIEKYKMIAFIDELLEPEIIKQQPEVPDDRLVVSEEVIPKKYSAKWHALQYLLELKANGLKPPLNTEGDFIKLDLEAIGRSRTGLKGQGFYRSVLKYYKDLDKPRILINSFGKDWKDTILTLSYDNKALKDYLNKHY